MTREEHIEWCKKRALRYLESGPDYSPLEAMTSMGSDLTKHPETRNHPGQQMAPWIYGDLSHEAARRWIEGFR